jgi:hypothetical protein
LSDVLFGHRTWTFGTGVNKPSCRPGLVSIMSASIMRTPPIILEVLARGVNDDLQPSEGVNGYDRMLGHREQAGLLLSHPGGHVCMRPVGQGNEIMDFLVAPDDPQNLKASSLQSQETVINFDSR